MNYRKSSKVVTIVATILLLYCIFAYSFEAVCYWIPNWYRNEYEKYNVLEDVRGEMSMDDAVYVTKEMLQYLRGNRDDLVIYANIDGKRVEFYSDREKAHLADCRKLFLTGLWIRRLAMLLVIAALVYLASIERKHSEFKLRLETSKTFVKTTAITLGIVGILAIIAVNNFTLFFDEFHKVFFDNDLYILDPRYDNLINLLPEGFFSDTIAMIMIIFAIVVAVLLVLAGIAIFKNRKEVDKNEQGI